MTPEAAGLMGERQARTLRDAIELTMDMPGLDKAEWWTGFLASLSAMCYVHIGDRAHVILASALNDALKSVTAEGGKH
jgi:hypothetical protein